jgi:ATP-dependent DNA helicase RecG
VEPEQIEQRLRLGEDSRTEFKSTARGELDAKDIGREIVALANTRGGQIFLGVEDDGTPIGLSSPKDADRLMQKVVNACQTTVHPAIYCPVIKVEVTGKLLLVIDVPVQSTERPYRAADHRYYIRDASVTREATREELLRMLQSRNTHYDEVPLEGATREDLDDLVIDDFLRTAYGAAAAARRAHYLQALQCVSAEGTPTVAGVLLFGREPQRALPDARISAVRFPGTRMQREMADRQELEGNLFRQLEGALSFLQRNVPAPARIEGWERKERGIPEGVLREAVLNAIVHRDYRAASQIRIFVYDDRVEVINPGLLLNHLTLDSIRLGGISQRRNPVLAAVLARAGKRESLGMGVPEMIEQMHERGLPEPEFDISGGHFRVVLRGPTVAEGAA